MASAQLHDIIDNVKNIYQSSSSLDTLMDFERVLDELDLYTYENWQSGEIVEGPIFEKYFVSVTLMFPYKKMPDPTGAERLQDYDCIVRYRKSTLEAPVKINDSGDYKPGTKYPKLSRYPIWLVEIIMSKSLMSEISRGSFEIQGETIDHEDLESAYEQGADEQEVSGEVVSDADATGGTEAGAVA